MNRKEASELSRRFKPEKTSIGKIYGCYVNSSKEVIAWLDESLTLMPQEEAQQYLAFLKKTLSGSIGRNLTDIVFSTEQVADSDEHRLLMALRDGSAEARQTFFQKVIENLDMGDENYLILCANEAYDVPRRSHDARRARRRHEGNHEKAIRTDSVFSLRDGAAVHAIRICGRTLGLSERAPKPLEL